MEKAVILNYCEGCEHALPFDISGYYQTGYLVDGDTRYCSDVCVEEYVGTHPEDLYEEDNEQCFFTEWQIPVLNTGETVEV